MTRAPGRLDVMGGIADYSGSLVLQLPLAQACHVAVQTHPLPQQRVWRHMQSRHVRTSSLLCPSYLPLLHPFVLPRARKRLMYQSHASTRAFRQDLGGFWGLAGTSKPTMPSHLTLSGDCSSSVSCSKGLPIFYFYVAQACRQHRLPSEMLSTPMQFS